MCKRSSHLWVIEEGLGLFSSRDPDATVSATLSQTWRAAFRGSVLLLDSKEKLFPEVTWLIGCSGCKCFGAPNTTWGRKYDPVRRSCRGRNPECSSVPVDKVRHSIETELLPGNMEVSFISLSSELTWVGYEQGLTKCLWEESIQPGST